jgi:formamidopyrimidine-DNA glycosylase
VPELPEVETVVRSLRGSLIGARIRSVHCTVPSLVGGEPERFCAALSGRLFEDVKRHGKYAFLVFSGGDAVAVHLGMTGQMLIAQPGRPTDKHTHLEIILDRSGQKLVYRDVRKFGRFAIVTGGLDSFVREKKLGPDALSVTPLELSGALRRTRRSIKAALLDQSVLAGLGNIYTDEVLYRIGAAPWRRADTLADHQVHALCENMRELLYAAIADSGTTISDYVDPEGRQGGFQFALQVYGRKGEACGRCGASVQRAVIAGRGTWYCPACQS